MQSPGQGLNIPSGSSVPVVVPIPTYQKKAPDTVVSVALQPSAVPTVVQEPTHRLLEVPTVPGASLLTPAPVMVAIPSGSQSIVNPSATPKVPKRETYKPLGKEKTVGMSLTPVFTQSEAIAPVANYINKDTTFWSAGNQTINPANSFSTLYVSSLFAGVASISTLNNSTINVNTIDIDGQILTADNDQLFLNGLPVATTANLSSIQDWALYEAVSSIRMLNQDIVGAKNIQAEGISSVLVLADVIDANNVYSQVVSSLVENTSSLTFVDGTGYQLGVYQATVSIIDSFNVNATTVFAREAVNTSSINTDSIYTYDVRLVSSFDATNDGVLTVSGDGNTLFFNGNAIAQQTQISSIADWSLYPSISTIQANNPIYNANGRLQLSGQGIDIGALGNTPSGSTNTMTIRSGDINIASDGGGGFNVATGLSLAAGAGFSLAGGAAGSITTGLVLLIQAGGALGLSAAGAVTIQAVGACSMAATGPVNIGSVAYTSLETIRIDNSLITRDTSTSDRLRIRDVQELQGNNDGGGGSGRLDILGNGVSINADSTEGITIHAGNSTKVLTPLTIKADGTTGTGLGTLIYNLEQNFQPSTQTINQTVNTFNITNTFPSLIDSRSSKVTNPVNNSSITHTLSETYDGNNTITYANTQGAVNIQGITNLNADTITTNTLNLSNLNLQNASISSLNVSSINANSIIASTIATPYFNLDGDSICIGLNTGNSVAGRGNISIGQNAGSVNQGRSPVAIGLSAGESNQQQNGIAIGYLAGANTQGANAIAIGTASAYNSQGSNSIYIGSVDLPLGDAQDTPPNTIVLNASGVSNPSPYSSTACYINPIRQPPSKTGFYTMGYNLTTHEVAYTTTLGLNELSTSVGNVRQISYSEGLLTTAIDGLLQVNGQAEFTQAITADTTFNSLHIANLSSLTLNGIPLASYTNTLLYNSTTKNVSYFPTTSVIPTVAVSQNVFYVAKGGSDTTGNGQSYNPYLTIQKAIDMCPVGSQDVGQTIYIMPGLYVEDLSIADKNINFRGSGDTNQTYNTTIRGNMTITSSNTNRSYRTVSFQFVQIQNYTATTGVAITLSTSGTGKGKLILTSCYVIGASTGVSLLSAIASNCDWQITMDATRFYTGFAYSAPLIDISGASTTAVGLTMNNCVAEYESPSGSTNSIIKVSGYAGMTLQYCTITQPLNVSLNNSALTNGLIWVNNVPNSGVVATSTNGVNVGTTLCFSGTQATLGVNGTVAMFISRGCPSVYVLTGTMSVRSNSVAATHCITGSTSAGTKTIVYYATGTLITTIGTANKIDNTNCTTTILTPVSG